MENIKKEKKTNCLSCHVSDPHLVPGRSSSWPQTKSCFRPCCCLMCFIPTKLFIEILHLLFQTSWAWTVPSLLFLLLLNFPSSSPYENGLARTPPMGWLAWERFRCNTDCENDPHNCIRYVSEGAVGNVLFCWLGMFARKTGQ